MKSVLDLLLALEESFPLPSEGLKRHTLSLDRNPDQVVISVWIQGQACCIGLSEMELNLPRPQLMQRIRTLLQVQFHELDRQSLDLEPAHFN
jgi:hypothetical protein